ncbi:cupin [Vibrio sp. SM6]|uniref:Cupin n=1 Tax=Vibrio agarilyticus TaxID=2726741 RepID=A0A7X8TRR3_9VIBR|nr:cupin domain-containing protein [Vibrio agarilyticus]NLS13412.1 cupin [Vibrio agarilyticus]
MINMNFEDQVWINTDAEEWTLSPNKAVWRKPLEREAAESGRATSLVKFAANATFTPHEHPGGEEIFVLDGVFSDEHGDYAAGSYLRNPANSHHTSFSRSGCTLLVKLNQFQADDHATVRIDTHQAEWFSGIHQVQIMPLHQFGTEHVCLVKWPKGERFNPNHGSKGEEVFILSGELREGQSIYPAHSWLRFPQTQIHALEAIEDSVIWLKAGHLPK